MSFTDEDLIRLKSDCQRQFTGISLHQKKAILGLIARLEAAEKFCNTHPSCDCTKECDYHIQAIEDWRKAAGKID